MREIKFRGLEIGTDWKRLEKPHWHYGGYRVVMGTPYIGDEAEYPVDLATVGQFTGICDKNGKEIFEGDILMCPTTGKREIYADVVWKNDCAGFDTVNYRHVNGERCVVASHFTLDECEVAGNIYLDWSAK